MPASRRPVPLQPTTSVVEWGCKGSARHQSANRPAEQRLCRGLSGYGSMRAGRIAVTQHIPGLSACESRTHACGRRKGHADPGVASGWATRWSKAVTGESPGRFMDGHPWVRSVRGCMAPSGRVVRPGRAVRFVRLIHRRVRALWRMCGPRRLRRHQSRPQRHPEWAAACPLCSSRRCREQAGTG